MKAFGLIYLRGLAMGAADVVPGVSGGTIAFLTGIYDRLLNALHSLPVAGLLVLRGRLQDAWKQGDGGFLLALIGGILSSVMTLAHLITYLLDQHPIPVWSFFFGLILISVYYVGREISFRSVSVWGCLLVGTLLSYWLTITVPVSVPGTPLNLFLAGSIAICAMILPGISGSFILVLMGLYPVVLGAVRDLDLLLMGVFGAGCLLGLVGFSRLLHWLLIRFRAHTLAALTGMMIGSLNKVWPWKETLSWRVNSSGESIPLLQQNVSPEAFHAVLNQEPHLALALIFALSGMFLVLVLESVLRRAQH